MKNTNRILSKCALLSIILFGFYGCTEDAETINRNYQLVWEDDFTGEEGQLPDASKWVFDVGTDWGNQQLEYDTDRAENVSTDGNGNLAIVAKQENFGGQPFTSGRIKTQGLFQQTYGRFEARMKLPWGPGIWPAFWLLGGNCETVTWPQCGEIDIMEYRGQQPTLAYGAVHGPGYSGGGSITKAYALQNDRYDLDFHVFGIEWGTDYIDYYVDDNLYQRITPADVPGEWVYDHDFFIILNLAVGGNYVGFPTTDTRFPQTLLVDYIRVYKEVN